MAVFVSRQVPTEPISMTHVVMNQIDAEVNSCKNEEPCQSALAKYSKGGLNAICRCRFQ